MGASVVSSKSKWKEFLDRYYKDELSTLFGKKALVVNFQDIVKFDFRLSEELLVNPDKVLKDAEDAASLVDLPVKLKCKPHIRVVHLPSKTMIRDLRSDHVNIMISLDVVVKKKTYVKPRIIIAAFECARCGNVVYLPQEGSGKFLEPSYCNCNEEKKGVFRLMFKESTFEDFQKIRVQESYDVLGVGMQPETIDLHLTNDLAGVLVPGMHIIVNGILRSVQKVDKMGKQTSFDTYIDVVSLEILDKDTGNIELSPEDVEKIEEFSQDKGLRSKLLKSIAPSIYDMEIVKEAVLLQLFGGVTKVKSDGMRIRGEIHVGLIGDPGIAKSKILTYACSLAPRSSYVSAQGATAAGITASAIKDDFGEQSWSIEAGAIVLASGGIAAIDEFEKMKPEVRTTLNEPMESGRISIAKAGICTDMPAETSVLIAANPVLGRFNGVDPFIDQCNIEPSLRTRFDLLISLPDVPEEKRDSSVADHVLGNHSSEGVESLDAEFIRKYISYAKRFDPDISPVRDALKEFYLTVRRDEKYRGVTVRMLESMIRLCEGAARMRLSMVVNRDDLAFVSRVMNESLKSSCTDASGAMDMDIITIGVGQSQQERWKKWKAILLEYKAGLSIDDLQKKLMDAGYDLKFFVRDLAKYKEIGEIHELREGIISLT